MGVLYLIDKLLNISLLLICGLDGQLRYLFPPELVEVFRNACHEHKFRNKDDGLVVSFLLVLSLEKWLLGVFDGAVVLVLVVLFDVGAIKLVCLRSLVENDILNSVVVEFSIVCHQGDSNQCFFNCISSALLVRALVGFVYLVDDHEGCLRPHYFIGGIHS